MESETSYQPPAPEEVIPYICENGETGKGWIQFRDYSVPDLQKIRDLITEKMQNDGDSFTQQLSPIDGRKMTYREVLKRVLSRVSESIEDKQSPRSSSDT